MAGWSGSRVETTLKAALAVVVLAALAGGGVAFAEETHPVQDGDTLESIAALHGVTTEALAEANGLDPWGPAPLGVELLIPTDGETGGDTGAEPAIVGGVPAYKQSRSLSCEYASIYIATAIFGDPLTEEHSLEAIPAASNPHDGYRGDIDGVWGNTDDYGVYAEVLASYLVDHGYVAEVAYEPSAAYLQSQIDAGRPVIVWISARGEPGFYEWDAAGNRYKLVPYMHVVVAYGYDDGGVYISDPGRGDYTYYSWEWFLDAWEILDGMALSVAPA